MTPQKIQNGGNVNLISGSTRKKKIIITSWLIINETMTCRLWDEIHSESKLPTGITEFIYLCVINIPS